jgi:hypothetical protein
MPPDAVREKLSGWDTQVLVIDGVVVGAAARRSGEFHFGILPLYRGKWATASNMKAILAWAAESGPVSTCAKHGSIGGRLAEFIGMRYTIASDKGVRYVYP